ncbi:hypothetical protein [Nisaea nitritireducens]|uniref:hypothetical protein n=1 Tax=Nisaea nitritireducens TaxID=568392 RepID=UPI001867A7AF|nr:hypothetical protein [Nisaea nitritireducens]
MTSMSEARFRELTDAFGSDPSKWPERERSLALQLLEAHPALGAVLDEAAALDFELDAIMAAPEIAIAPSPAEVRAPANLNLKGLLNAFWPFGGLWQPAAGLVAASAAGFIVGMTFTDLPAETTTTVISDQVTIVERALGADVEESFL